MEDTFPAKFKCAKNLEWHVKLTMSKVVKFCGQRGLRIEEINSESLNEEQLIDLLFMGIQHHQDAKGLTIEDFMDENLAGEVYMESKKAALYAIVNFSLPRLPEAQRVSSIKQIKDSLEEIDEKEGTLSQS